MDKKKNVYKATPPVRKPRMYLNRSRFCGECGSSNTCDKIVNHVQWHRDIDEQGKWTGKYLCSTCYHRQYRKRREQETALMRQMFIDERSYV